MRSDDVNGRGYAPKGKTPVRRAKGTPEKINMISTVTNRGKLRFMFYKERMRADVLIRFLKRLIRDAGRKVYLILDNLRVYHPKKVKAWVEEHQAQLALFHLPGCSPDLNPAEYLNNDLKKGVTKNPDPTAERNTRRERSRPNAKHPKTARQAKKTISRLNQCRYAA